jgi:hypothetical protein
MIKALATLVGIAGLVFVSGCFEIEEVNPKPLEHRTEYLTTGYTLSGCQDNLDELAGGKHVQMTEHADSQLQWLNLGLTPIYHCRGFTELPQTSAIEPNRQPRALPMGTHQ